jgi:hypothetical protein
MYSGLSRRKRGVHIIQDLRPTLLLHAEVGYASQRRRSKSTRQCKTAKSHLADRSDWYAKVAWHKRKFLVALRIRDDRPFAMAI